ncbi:MAG: anthranilate synthase component I, partial [Chloroflexota bacterium]
MLLESTQVQTIIREVSADLETPVSLYLKLRGDGASFLLESVEGGERIARYSFIGVQPRAEYILRDNEIEINDEHGTRITHYEGDPTRFLQAEMDRFPAIRLPNAPRFTGGLVGYLGYESVRFFEPTLSEKMKRSSIPDGIYLLADTIVAFDHARRTIFLIANVLDGDAQAAEGKLDSIAARIHEPLPAAQKINVKPSKVKASHTQGTYEDMVRAAKEHI